MDYKVPMPKQVSQDAGPGKFARAAGPAEETLMGTELLQAAKLGDTFALSNLVSLSNDMVSSDSVVIPLTEPGKTKDNGITKDNALAVTACGNSILHIAARHGRYEFVEYVSKREPALITAVNSALETPLHCCAKVGHNNIVSLIIDANVKHSEVILLARNVNGDTALHEAILNGHITVVKTLVEKGYSKLKHLQEKNEEDMDKKLKECIVNNAGATPLYLAVMQNSAEVVQLLLQQPLLFPSAPNLLSYYQGPNGKTALHAAVIQSYEITKLLLESPGGRQLVLKKDNSSNIPLHYVAASGDKTMVSVLLKKDASTGYASDKQQAGAIHVAARMGHVDVIREILEHCPDGHELVDRDGRSFLHVGVLNQKRSVVRYVLRTPGLESLLNTKDRSGDTALHLAVKMENKRVVYDLISDKRVQISPLNNIGYTPLDLADKLETGIRYILNNHYIITGCLAEMGAVFSPQILDCTATDTEESKGGVSSTATNYTGKNTTSSENKTPKTESGDTETKSQMSLSKNLAILSALIATVAFGAGFTVPGGYRGDRAPGEGTAILTNKYSFRVFLISDTTALVCSLIATFWLMYGVAPKVDMKIRMRHLIWSLTLLWVSFSCIGMAFGMAAFAVVAPQSRHIGILVAAIAFVSPPITALVTTWPVISLLRTRIARLGCIEGMRGARMNPYTKWRIAERTKITTFSKIGDISVVLSVYALVLCLAKL